MSMAHSPNDTEEVSMIEQLPAIAIRIENGTFTCRDLVRCVFHLSETELLVLNSMDETEPLTAGEVGMRIGRDRVTAYRALEKLVALEIAYRERKGGKNRGYAYYYRKAPGKDILFMAEQRLDACYTAIKKALEDEVP